VKGHRPSRRAFITRTVGSTAAGLLLGLPKGWVGTVYADDSPEVSDMRFGIIALSIEYWIPASRPMALTLGSPVRHSRAGVLRTSQLRPTSGSSSVGSRSSQASWRCYSIGRNLILLNSCLKERTLHHSSFA